MSFKITSKNFMLFCLYCIILLYLCAIAVLNFASLTNNGTFYGLLPFRAFSGEYIGYTFALFIASLLLIFSGVQSYIFDKDKNGPLGIHISNKTDGYSSWADERDIKTDKGITKISPLSPTLDAAGIPLINKGRTIWVDNGEYHNLVLGATGSGKTECIVKPLVNILSKKGESMVITDPKGEIYEYCAEALKASGYHIVVLNFREPQKGNAWNPLALPYKYYKEGNRDKSTELLQDIASNVMHSTKESNADPFWEDSAADYFSGLTLGLFQDAEEKEVNFNSINYMATAGEEKRGPNTYLKEYFTSKGESAPAYIFASNTVNAPNDTKGSIVSTFKGKIRIFSTQENLSEMLSYSDFNMQDIGNEKTAVFMIIHDEKKTYHGLMSIFIKQCYETLVDCAQKSGGKLKYRTNFILDEFANMPPLKDVDSMVTAARSRKIRFTFIIQNFSQLDDVYGHELAETIRGNCGNLIYLISTELKALEEISKMCGEIKSKEKDKTASTPLVTVTDLQKLKLFEAIIIRWRKSPFKTSLTPDFKIDWGIKREKAVLPTRQMQEIKLFDIKKFVSETQKKDLMNNQDMGENQLFGGMGGGFNPFMDNASPFGMGSPFGMKDSFSPSPFGQSQLDNDTFFNNRPQQNSNNDDIFGSLSSSELDKMVEDIEKKLKELDEEEAKNSEKLSNQGKQKIEEINFKEVEDVPEVDTIDGINTKDIEIDDDTDINIDVNNYTNSMDDKNETIEVRQINEVQENPSIENIKTIEESPEDSLDLTTELKLDLNEFPNKNYNNELDLTQEIKLDEIAKPKINVDKDSIVVDENIVTDDEFYDDFFEE